MRIESVTAHAFGPIVGQTLKLAPQMTIIVGDNESAKSSWHAAIYAALCGRRRGKGPARTDERRFADLHRPWDGSRWRVSAMVSLDDGRRIELDQDLDGGSGSSARDIDLGARDVSGEIMHGGAPDAARWLGLDRGSFVATACVRQAQLLGVLEGAETLQSHLERAAATAGIGSSATEALERLKTFHRARVGRDDARSSGPLRQAIRSFDEARRNLDVAREVHARHLEACEEAERLSEEEVRASRRRDLLEAAAAAERAQVLRDRYARALELHERSRGVAPTFSVGASDLWSQVAQALEAWEQRAEVPAPEGPSAAELERQIAMLPRMPEGPVSVSREIEDAYEDLRRCERELEHHELRASGAHQGAHQGARGVVQPVTSAGATPEGSPAGNDREATSRRAAVVAGAGVLVALSGALAGVSGSQIAGMLLAVAGGALIVAGVISRFVRKGRPLGSARAEMPGSEALDATGQAWDRLWHERRAELLSHRSSAQLVLREALVAGGAPVAEDVAIAFDEHRRGCVERSRVAEQAQRRAVLEAQIVERRNLEKLVEKMRSDHERALSRLLDAAKACGMPAASSEEALYSLRTWRQRREAGLDDLELRQREWEELKGLLAGGTIDELAVELENAGRDAAVRSARVGDAHLELDELHREARSWSKDRIAALVEDARREATEASAAAHRARGALDTQREQLPAVAEAEEALALAGTALEQLRDLDRTLKVTAELLESAQKEVQRGVAPRVASMLTRWLPRITDERYADATVDPKSLVVMVRDPTGRWHSADHLSHGTTEQVYLLLRAALSECLSPRSESCPLLLDDVTVHADARRTIAVLEWLHEISAERQVVLFTQEAQVESWARRSLREPLDVLQHLPVVAGGFGR